MTDAKAPNSYAQWIAFFITNSTKNTLSLGSPYLEHGKFYYYDDKDNEMETSHITQIRILSNGISKEVGSCGRASAMYGTEGTLDIMDGGVRVATFWWDCPWTVGSTNKWGWKNKADGYYVNDEGGSSGGAIGVVNIEVGNT